ncbi:MAG: methylmalonyl Co-A mutase-associated GTPase MeaB [Pseudomonadota bacterium]|nr:methylmalonyl Co-A mutase-associated GTPase MeaB [Pseudomonadota bacterium]
MVDTRDKKVLELIKRITCGERRALSQAITFSESTRKDHRDIAKGVLSKLNNNNDKTVRIAVTGSPGVGKSTFIESFGLDLINKGLNVAVLAVDPSSVSSGGSILGDKTRMELLSKERRAYIRPSPTKGSLGGTNLRTQEAIILCEAAGFDVILIETVGVGQSETMASQMVDVFCLLLGPSGGDELQGVKRGITEISDLILVNKCDGQLKNIAETTRAEYSKALQFFRRREIDAPSYPKVLTISSIEKSGLRDTWKEIKNLITWRKQSGMFFKIREEQKLTWFHREITNCINLRIENSEKILKKKKELEKKIRKGLTLPLNAAEKLALEIIR